MTFWIKKDCQEKTAVLIKIPVETKRLLRVVAAVNNCSVTSLLNEYINDGLMKNAKDIGVITD